MTSKIDSQNLRATFLRFVIPTVAALMVNGTYQIIDGIFIGNFVGNGEGLTAINTVWPLTTLLIGLGLMIGVGTGASCSIQQGKKDIVAAKSYLAQLFWLVAICSIPVFLILHYGADYAFNFQKAIPLIKEMAYDYLRVIQFSAPVMIFSIAAPMVVRNLGAPILSTVSLVVGALVKIIADYLLIVVFDQGLFGAAIATIVGELVTEIICVVFILSKRNPLKLSLTDIAINASKCKNILSIGFSSMFLYIYVGFITVLFNKEFMEYGNENYVAAFAIIGYVVTMFVLLAEGIASGMQPVVSYFYGARQFKNMNKILGMAYKSACTMGFAFSLIILFFTNSIVGFFVNNPEVQSIAVYGIRIMLCLLVLDAYIIVTDIFFQSIGAAKKAIFISVSNLTIKIPVLLLMSHNFGITGIFITIPVANFFLALVVFMLYYMEKKRIKKSYASARDN